MGDLILEEHKDRFVAFLTRAGLQAILDEDQEVPAKKFDIKTDRIMWELYAPPFGILKFIRLQVEALGLGQQGLPSLFRLMDRKRFNMPRIIEVCRLPIMEFYDKEMTLPKYTNLGMLRELPNLQEAQEQLRSEMTSVKVKQRIRQAFPCEGTCQGNEEKFPSCAACNFTGIQAQAA